MMKTKILLLLLVFARIGFAQDVYNDIRYNRAVLKYYNGNEIIALEEQDSVNFEKVKYYFTRSFTVVDLNCESCQLDYLKLFNLDLFNVYDFEHLRLESAESEFIFKDQYKITLSSVQQVESNLGNTPISSITKLKPLRAFPVWEGTGDNEEDYNSYKVRVAQWALDFPEEYRSLNNSESLIKITKAEFFAMPEARRSVLFSNAGGYYIID